MADYKRQDQDDDDDRSCFETLLTSFSQLAYALATDCAPAYQSTQPCDIINIVMSRYHLILTLLTALLVICSSFQNKHNYRQGINVVTSMDGILCKRHNTVLRTNALVMKSSIPVLPTFIETLKDMPRTVQTIINVSTSTAINQVKAAMLLLAVIVTTFRGKIASKVSSSVADVEKKWVKKGSKSAFTRSFEVWIFAISFLFQFVQVKKMEKGDPAQFSLAQRDMAKQLTNKLLELGPTFIKVGQLLSTRIDVLPKEYIEELCLLQDKVPGFSGDIAVSIIEKELGKPISQLYDTFDRTPLAAASLGQVHLATKNGKKFAVKVQRQGLRELFDMDLKNIKLFAIFLDKFDPKSDGAARDWASIYDESARLLYQEIDYELEARNCMRFRENFVNEPWIKVPEVDFSMTTKIMITMEFVPGIKINDIEAIDKAGIDRKVLARRSAESYLAQVCRHGFFHCDPHPGNVACDAENGGRLIYYDFGMMDELKPQVKKGLVNLIFGVYENETKEVCDALEEIEVLNRGVDRFSVEKIVRFFLKEFSSTVNSKDAKWVNQMSKDDQREIRRQRRAQLGSDLFSVGGDVPFKFPPTFTFVFRAFTSLDGIGKGLDSSYDLSRLAQPFLRELVDLRDGSAALSFLKSAAKAVGWRPEDIANLVKQPRKIANIDDVVSRMEQGDLKLRVRVLESERSFKRLELVQNNMALAIAASGFLNVGILLASFASPAGKMSNAAKAALALAGVFGVQIPIGLAKLSSLDKKFSTFTS